MNYTIDADEEFLRVTVNGRDVDRPPSEVCAAVLAASFTPRERIALVHRTPEMQEANQFINLVASNHGVMVRNFTGLEPAKAWLRGEAA